MADTSINLASLDFEKIKDNLRQYLQRSDSPFKDYLYEGSNIAELIDLLSYNTYLNSFYLNMVGSEMFLDSAQLRDSVASHAKELAYVPRSYRSAVADISFSITPVSPIGALLVPKGTTFTTKVGSNTFTFSTAENSTIPASEDGIFYANLSIYEGIYVSDSFIVDPSNTNQRFVLSNPTVDTRSITVSVVENNGANIYSYTRATSFLGLTETSPVYYLQVAENSQYEILFGDNYVSKKPKNGSIVVVEYRVCNANLPNGASVFTIDGPISGQANISSIKTLTGATGGDVNESIESIKLNAPRHYQNQERAITTLDYESLLKTNFPEIIAVSAFGGEEADTPVYGKVYVSVDVKNIDGLPDSLRKTYYDFLKTRCSVSIDPVIITPEYTYLELYTRVRYNINKTTLKTTDMRTIITSIVSKYNIDNLSDFKKTLRYSNLVTKIDQAHQSIISNDTFIRPYKIITPNTDIPKNFVINFSFPLSPFNNQTAENLTEESRSITSDPFLYDQRTCYLNDDGQGTMNIVTRTDNNQYQIINRIGTVDYKKGSINISNFNAYAPDGLKVFADTVTKDITASKNTILTILDKDIIVDIEQVNE